MPLHPIDWFAVIAATAASFAFGGAYYMVLARRWMAALGKTEAELKANRSAVPFIVSAVAGLVTASMLSALGAVDGVVEGLGVGAVCWLGFIITTLSVNHSYQGRPLALTLIDGGHWLGVLLLQGLVIGLVAG